MEQGEGFLATGEQGARFVLLFVYHFVDKLAIDPFQAQFVSEGARTTRTELLAILDPEAREGAIIDVIEMIQARQGCLDDFRRRFLAQQVAANLCAAARAIRDEVEGALNGLLLDLIVVELIELLRRDFLLDVHTQLQYERGADAQQEAAINEEVNALRVIHLWFKSGDAHKDTITFYETMDKQNNLELYYPFQNPDFLSNVYNTGRLHCACQDAKGATKCQTTYLKQ